MKQLLYIAILVCSLWSCTDSMYTERLQHIETIIESQPDTALAMLQSIDYGTLTNDMDKALYGMLYTEALDKNHEPIPDDSLINFAAQYFSDHNDKRRSMIALNYKGRVQYMNARYAQALVSFMEAHELANEFDDKFWIGMTARGIADIYNESFNNSESLVFATKEYTNIKLSNRQPYLNYALLDLANAYCNASNHKKSIELCETIIDSANIYHDQVLYVYAQQLIASNSIYINDMRTAINILESLNANGLSEPTDSFNLALAYAHTSHPDKALDLIRQVSITSGLNRAYVNHKIFRKLGMHKEALSELEVVDSLTNRIFKTRVNQNITGSAVDYMDLSKQKTSNELKTIRTQHNLTIVSFILLIITIIITVAHIYYRQRQKFNDKLIFVERLQNLLQQSQSDNSKAASTIRDLFASRYEILEKICDILLRYNDPKYAKQRIANSITDLINSLSIRSKKIIELENEIDKLYNNLFTNFRQDLPTLKDVDYRLFLFTILGLSTTTISLLLKEEKLSAIYDRKRRLRDKIKKLDPTKRDRYLSFMS